MRGAAILFMLFDGITKSFKPSYVVDSVVKLGFEEHHIYAMSLIGLAWLGAGCGCGAPRCAGLS